MHLMIHPALNAYEVHIHHTDWKNCILLRTLYMDQLLVHNADWKHNMSWCTLHWMCRNYICITQNGKTASCHVHYIWINYLSMKQTWNTVCHDVHCMECVWITYTSHRMEKLHFQPMEPLQSPPPALTPPTSPLTYIWPANYCTEISRKDIRWRRRQYTASYCNTVQHTATHWNTL